MIDEISLNKMKLIPYFKGIISELYPEKYDAIDLTLLKVTPSDVDEILQLLGYNRDAFDANGWEQDAWYYYSKDGIEGLCLYYCGFYGNMNLSLVEDE